MSTIDFTEHLTGNSRETHLANQLYRDITVLASCGRYAAYNEYMRYWSACPKRIKNLKQLEKSLLETFDKLNIN